MRQFNKQLNKDITLLKSLHAKKDKADFNRMKNEIMKRHKLSKATVYRELKKETPGLYKTPQYRSHEKPVTEKEIKMVRELLMKQYTIQNIVAIMDRETGDTYNWDRVDKIRKSIENYDSQEQTLRITNEKQKDYPKESAFGEDVKNLLMNIYKLDKMAEDSFVTLNVDGKTISIDYQTIKDIMLMISNCADAENRSVAETARIQVFHLLAEKVRLAAKGQCVSTRALADLSAILRSYEKTRTSAFSPDYRVLLEVVHELAPDASYLEIYQLAEKHQKLIKGSTEAIVPDITPLQEQAVKEMEELM